MTTKPTNALDPRDMTSLGELETVKAALERDRVVRVLDGWCARSAYSLGYRLTRQLSGWTLSLGAGKHYSASTPDAVRALAAAAIESGEV